MKLTDTFIRYVTTNGKVQKHSDGGGLFLYSTPTGKKLWRLAYLLLRGQAEAYFPWAVSVREPARGMRKTGRCPKTAAGVWSILIPAKHGGRPEKQRLKRPIIPLRMWRGNGIQKLHLILTSDADPDRQLEFTLDAGLAVPGLKVPKAKKGTEGDATFFVNTDVCAAVADMVEGFASIR